MIGKRYWARVAAVACAAMMLLMTSCGSKKGQEDDTKRVSVKSEVFRTLSVDKAVFSLTLAGTDMNSSGSIRICRDSVIICSIMPIPGMEFFRFAINKTGVILINRVDKKFVSVSFAEMHSKGMRLNYQAFESIFTNRLFLYGEDYFPKASDFNIHNSGGNLQLTRTDGDVLQEFKYNSKKQLTGGSLALGNTYSTKWTYDNFKEVNGLPVPHDFTLSLQKGAMKRTIGVHYDAIELDKDRKFDIKIPATYERLTMQEFLQKY